ncbi:hypothetical protein WMY93_023355 [Mugilogobius chulae]|uniref:Cocaine- and amphetamine-regulated transcript protein n=1 Tax=Mugilogobius chulae TaxID=88201 RepID=A0AAW0NG55_9GOBI
MLNSGHASSTRHLQRSPATFTDPCLCLDTVSLLCFPRGVCPLVHHKLLHVLLNCSSARPSRPSAHIHNTAFYARWLSAPVPSPINHTVFELINNKSISRRREMPVSGGRRLFVMQTSVASPLHLAQDCCSCVVQVEALELLLGQTHSAGKRGSIPTVRPSSSSSPSSSVDSCLIWALSLYEELSLVCRTDEESGRLPSLSSTPAFYSHAQGLIRGAVGLVQVRLDSPGLLFVTASVQCFYGQSYSPQSEVKGPGPEGVRFGHRCDILKLSSCGMGDRCAMKFGPRIGKLCDCGRGANCNSFLLKCI